MKKILVLAVVAIATLSCEKTYQCQCTEVFNGQDWNATVTNVAIEERSKKNAEAKCKSLEYSQGWQAYKSCKLK